jgi:hypothetical protein
MAVWIDFKIKNHPIQKRNYMRFDFILDDLLKKKYRITIGTQSGAHRMRHHLWIRGYGSMETEASQ